MKNTLFITGLLVMMLLASCKPNAEDILKKSLEKCQSVENGYYEMTHYMKYMSGNDTTTSNYNCYFKKLAADTIYSFAFHYQQYKNGEYSGDVLYTGDNFVSYSENDSTTEIKSNSLWAKDIKSRSHNNIFYKPITKNDCYPLPTKSDYVNNKQIFQFVGEENINEFLCYHIKKNDITENDSTAMIKTLRNEINYWINKKDNIPIQYTIAIEFVLNNDTLYQFEKNVLTKYELNNLKDESPITLSSVSSHINLIDYVPHKRPELLPVDTLAPNWSLLSTKDETVNMSNLKGDLILLDFFYKSCYPCVLALPALQNLHEKYEGKGLRIIGIDPVDTKEKDEIDKFLTKHGVTYTILLGGKGVAKEYHVSSYPTIYLIDKKGKIIFSKVGYSNSTEAKLEKIIIDNL